MEIEKWHSTDPRGDCANQSPRTGDPASFQTSSLWAMYWVVTHAAAATSAKAAGNVTTEDGLSQEFVMALTRQGPIPAAFVPEAVLAIGIDDIWNRRGEALK